MLFFHIIILILLKYKHYHEIFARFSGPRGPSMTHFCTNLLMNLLTNLQVAYEKVILHLRFFNKKCPKLYKSMFHFFLFYRSIQTYYCFIPTRLCSFKDEGQGRRQNVIMFSTDYATFSYISSGLFLGGRGEWHCPPPTSRFWEQCSFAPPPGNAPRGGE